MSKFILTCLKIFAVVLVAISSKTTAESSEFCVTAACNKTSAYLGLQTLVNSTINPCDDFPEFLRQGWRENRPKPVIAEVIRTVFGRIVKLLEESNAGDAKITKVAKKVFRNCLNSDDNHLASWNDMVDYLKTLGSSPLISGSSWQPSSFSLKKLFKAEPKLALKVFFNRQISACPDDSSNSICLRDIGYDLLGLTNYEAFLWKMFDLKALEHSEVMARINETAKALTDFDRERAEFIPLFTKPTSKIALSELSSLLDIDFAEVLTAIRPNGSNFTSNDSIGVEYVEGGRELLKFVKNADARLLADRFVVHFLYEYRGVFGQGFLNEIYVALTQDKLKACLMREMSIFFPVLSSLYNKAFYDPKVKLAIMREVEDATQAFINHGSKRLITEQQIQKIMESLRTLKFHDGYTELGWANQRKIDEIYKNFDLTGDESEFTKERKLQLPHNKVASEPIVHYDYERSGNVLSISSFYLSHPSWFDAQRPKFFIAATTFIEISKITAQGSYDTSIAFNHYNDWLLAGNQDLKLNAGNFTNRQLFWMAFAMDAIAREELYEPESRDEFLHVRVKMHQEFQEAFGCEMTEAEEAKLRLAPQRKPLRYSEEVLFFLVSKD